MTQPSPLPPPDAGTMPHQGSTPAPAKTEDALDEALEESFPASDPVAISTGTPHRSSVGQS